MTNDQALTAARLIAHTESDPLKKAIAEQTVRALEHEQREFRRQTQAQFHTTE